VSNLFSADIYKEKSRGSAKAQFSIDEVCGIKLVPLILLSLFSGVHQNMLKYWTDFCAT